MIVWKGFGFLVPLVTFGCLVATELLVESALGDEAYYQERSWPMALGFALAGAVIALVAPRFERGGARVDDEKTEEALGTEKGGHSFMFIPMRYWTPLLFAISVAITLLKPVG